MNAKTSKLCKRLFNPGWSHQPIRCDLMLHLINNKPGGVFSSLSLMTPPSGSWQQISCSTFTLCSLFFLPCSLHTHIDRLVDPHIVGLRADHRGGTSALLWPWVVCLSLIFFRFFFHLVSHILPPRVKAPSSLRWGDRLDPRQVRYQKWDRAVEWVWKGGDTTIATG